MQRLLRAGLALSFVLFAAGMAVKLAGGASDAPAVKLFHLSSASDGGDLLMALGVLVLAATPAMRVVALIILWAQQRDRRYVGVAIAVLVVLIVAVVVGHG